VDLLCFPWQPQHAQRLQRPDEPSVCIFALFKAMCWQLLSFCPVVMGIFYENIAFVCLQTFEPPQLLNGLS